MMMKPQVSKKSILRISAIPKIVAELIRCLVYLLLLLVILVVVVLVVLQTNIARDCVVRLGLQVVEERYDVQIGVSRITGSLASGFSLEDLNIWKGRGVFLQAHRVAANYRISRLFNRVLFIETLELSNLEVKLEKAADGTWNIPMLVSKSNGDPPTDGKSLNLTTVIKRIHVVSSNITFTDYSSPTELVRYFENIDLKGALKLTRRLSLELKDLSFDIEPNKISFIGIHGLVSYAPKTGSLLLNKFAVKTTASSISVEGELSGLKTPQPHVDTRIDLYSVSLAEIERIFPTIKPFAQGSSQGVLQVKGQLRNPEYRLELKWDTLEVAAKGDISVSDTNCLGGNVSAAIRHLNPELFFRNERTPLTGDVNLDLHAQATNVLQPERRVSVTLGIKRSQLPWFVVEEGSMNANISGDTIELHDCRLTTPCGSFTGFGEIGGRFTESQKKIKFEALINDLDHGCIGLQLGHIDFGRMSMKLRIDAAVPAANWSEASVAMAVRFEPFVLSEIKIDSSDLDATWDRGKLVINELNMETQAAGLALAGTVFPEEARNVHITLGVPDIRDGIALIGTAIPFWESRLENYRNIDGNLRISGVIKGGFAQPEVDVELEGTSFGYKELDSGPFKLNGTWNGTPKRYKALFDLSLENVLIAGYMFPRLRLNADVSPVEAIIDARITDKDGLELAVSGLAKDWAESTKTFVLDTVDVSCEGPPLVNMTPIRFSLSPHFLDIESFNLSSDIGTLSAQGRFERFKNESITFVMNNMSLGYASWFHHNTHSISGTISGRGRIAGWLDQLAIAGAIEGAGVAFGEWAVDTLRLRGTWNGRVDDLVADGELIAERIQINNHNFPRLATTISVNSDLLNVRMQGDLSSDSHIELNGQVEQWSKPNKQITIDSLVMDTKGVKSMNHSPIFMQLSPKYLEVSPFHWILGDAKFEVGGRLSHHKQQDFNLVLKNWDVSTLSRFLPKGNTLQGLLSTEISIKGRANSPLIQGDLSIVGGAINGQPVSKFDLNFDYQEGRAEITGSGLQDGMDIFNIEGTADFTLSLMPFNLTLSDDNLDVSLLVQGIRPAVLPLPDQSEFDVDGILTLHSRLHGDLRKPTITGKAMFEDGWLTLKETNLTYEEFIADCTLATGKIIINALRIHGDMEGTLNCSGDITLAGMKPEVLNLHLTGSNIDTRLQTAISARVQPDIALVGPVASPQLSGTILVNECRINLDRLTNRQLSEVEVVTNESERDGDFSQVERNTRTLPFIESLSTDIAVDIPGNAWIRDKDMNVELRGHLKLNKEAEERFTITGALNSVRGTYSTRGKLFKVTKGNVTFVGVEDPNPNLDIEAVTRINNTDIIIRIGGTAKDIKVSLDSVPQMSQADIISYLVFGKSIDSLEGQQAFNSEKMALSLTGGVAADELRRIIGDAFIFDTVTIDAGGDDLSSGSLSVGKYIAPEIFVTYQQGFTSDEPPQVKVNYEIQRNLSIETQIGNEKTNGVDVIWHLDFW